MQKFITRKNLLPVLLLTLLSLLTACAKPAVIVDLVLVQNMTATKITDLTIRHEPTQRFGEANVILAGKSLEIGLSGGGQPLLAKQAIIQWRDSAGREWSVAMDLPYDQNMAAKRQPVNLVYMIYSDGRAAIQMR